MKFNQSLTAAITAAALVAGAGFAYAQTAATNVPGETNAQGTLTQAQPADSTLQAQPSTSTGTSMDTTTAAPSTMDTTLEPRADRN
ncbi:MAG: hypothetical protein V4711_09580 [Pseudomonadota bacterium]